MKFEIPKLARCCFCMPLRRGILTLGYVGVILSSFMIGMCSYYIHYGEELFENHYHGSIIPTDNRIALALYCSWLLAHVVLIYGALLKNVMCLKIFYYYTLSTIGAVFILQIVIVTRAPFFLVFEYGTLTFTILCIEVYVLILVRSLLIKLERMITHHFNNQLHEIVIGERKADDDDVSDAETLQENNLQNDRETDYRTC